jgi:MoaA/NifB/PqqE/SkfB family radical SAM enzyme
MSPSAQDTLDGMGPVDVSLLATGCACSCRHCYASARHKLEAPIDAARASEILDLLSPLFGRAEKRLVDIYYDLFDHPDVPGMVELLHERGLYGYFVGLATHGGGIARSPENRAFLADMKEMGTEFVQFTLHGMEETHDWFVRRKGAFRDLLAAAHAVQDAGLDLQLLAFANKRNIDELPGLSGLLRDEGLFTLPDVPFHVFTHAPNGYASDVEHLLPDYDDALKLKQSLTRGVLPTYRPEREWRQLALEGEHAHFGRKYRNAIYFAIDGNLNVTADFGAKPLGNLRADDLPAIVRNMRRHEESMPEAAVWREIERDGTSPELVRLAEQWGDPTGKTLYRVGVHAMAVWIRRGERGAGRGTRREQRR